MEQILASAPSPAELQDLADELAHNLAAAAAALESENLTESKSAVTTAHASWHAWDSAANTYLTDAQGHEEDGHSEGSDQDPSSGGEDHATDEEGHNE